MKNKVKNNFVTYSILFLCVMASFSSCKKALDILPEDKLDVSQTYNNLSDADAAVIGIYGKFAALGKQYILMNELRADLVDVTPNADPYLKQISDHKVTEDNPYVSPRPFYELILNCNDALKNFDIMVKQSKMSVAQYQKRYSDIGILRSWLYLQLGIHYGSVPYITNTIENVNDVDAIENYPKTAFPELLDALIDFAEKLPYKDNSYAYPAGETLVYTVDGSSTNKIFINKPALLGDLYLWKGNYYEAAKNYKKILTSEDNNTNLNVLYDSYRMIYTDSYAEHTVSYLRFQEESSLVNSPLTGWRAMFALPNTNRSWNTEWLWSMPYNASFAPGNPFVELCSSTYGKYLIKPSARAISIWNSQTQLNGIPYDARGVLSYGDNPNKPELRKLFDGATPLTMLTRSGNWNIVRAAGIHLRFAEAANRDGQSKLGWSLLNRGIKTTFYNGTYDASGNIAAASLAELNTQITPYAKDSPYYFDARDNSLVVRGVWYRNIGVRTRANMPPIDISYQTDMLGLEDKLIEEDARELAFEGERWSDLMRVALRRNDPAFLADKIYDKLLKAGNPEAAAVQAKLMNTANWYLPFKWK